MGVRVMMGFEFPLLLFVVLVFVLVVVVGVVGMMGFEFPLLFSCDVV